MSWWLAALFGFGALCFAIGSLPLFFDHVAPGTVATMFFVGSIFFTTAAYLQFHETLTAPAGVLPESRPRRRRPLRGAPGRIDWWATAVQLVGTVLFNVSTFAATQVDLGEVQERRLIWGPDLAGSVCFLIASWLAYSEVNRGIVPRPDRSVGWRIAALNLVGSVAFGAAAIAARYLRTTDEPANITLVNLGTFVGAICFLVGAALLPVESAKDDAGLDEELRLGGPAPTAP
ncbi:YrhK family protein [Occultella aeris]|uniref:YrhK domain-containing protein n=1 Tax=Occultella aeris TaxID=2761496 RepID=A0A7M4DH06_9MICO|nr:YrhK family protein [Occultella aeris]VZO36199.1 hypothetical protein HALOF300_01403 [Occultella aeris]